MVKLAFFARFEAKPGKEAAVTEFLETALNMAKKEPTTINWYALKLSPTTFGVLFFAKSAARESASWAICFMAGWMMLSCMSSFDRCICRAFSIES